MVQKSFYKSALPCWSPEAELVGIKKRMRFLHHTVEEWRDQSFQPHNNNKSAVSNKLVCLHQLCWLTDTSCCLLLVCFHFIFFKYQTYISHLEPVIEVRSLWGDSDLLTTHRKDFFSPASPPPVPVAPIRTKTIPLESSQPSVKNQTHIDAHCSAPVGVSPAGLNVGAAGRWNLVLLSLLLLQTVVRRWKRRRRRSNIYTVPVWKNHLRSTDFQS